MRPFEEQSTLERVLRSHLYHPVELLKNYDSRMKQFLKDREYSLAAELEMSAIKARREVDSWNHLLDLYETEFAATRPVVAELIPTPNP